MILQADWVVPVSGPPIRQGAVLVDGTTIAAVGTFADVLMSAPEDDIELHEGCVIVPGLVNAHTHLSLTVLGGLVPPSAMRPFLKRVAAAVRVLDDGDLASSAAAGVDECLASGVTTVGDIVYGPEALNSAAIGGLGGVFFWEVLGITDTALARELEKHQFPRDPRGCVLGRERCGLSPHTPYTSGPRLLCAVADLARKYRLDFAIHVAESEAEEELMLHGTGPLVPSAARLARRFKPPGVSSVAYLDSLGVLTDAIAIHCVHLQPGDVERLRAHARAVVLCPRSNAFLENGSPPVRELAAAGLMIALGTDSSASNVDLCLLSEARALRDLYPSLSAQQLLEIVTINGAKALGVADSVGTLEAGKSADLAIFAVGPTDQPVEAVLSQGCRDSARMVMSQGLWRIREGKQPYPGVAVMRGAERAREKAAAVIGRVNV